VHAVARFRGNKGGYLITSLESIPRKVLLYEKLSSLPSAQRLYISDPSGRAESLELGSGFRIELLVGVQESSEILRVE
jgi:hypothetical protein